MTENAICYLELIPYEMMYEINSLLGLKYLFIMQTVFKGAKESCDNIIKNMPSVSSLDGNIRYVGAIQKNCKHGYGILTKKTGRFVKERHCGLWLNNKFVKGFITKTSEKYICSFSGDEIPSKKLGFTKIVYNNEQRYREGNIIYPIYYLGDYSYSNDEYSGNYPNGFGMQEDKNYYSSFYYKLTNPFKNHQDFNFMLLEKVKKENCKYIGYYLDGNRHGYGCANDVNPNYSTNPWGSWGRFYREGIWDNDRFRGVGVEYNLTYKFLTHNQSDTSNNINITQIIKLGYYDNNGNLIEKTFNIEAKSTPGYGYEGWNDDHSTLTYEYYKVPHTEKVCHICSDALCNISKTKTILNTRKKRFSGMILGKTIEDFKSCKCKFCKYIVDNNLVEKLNNIKDMQPI